MAMAIARNLIPTSSLGVLQVVLILWTGEAWSAEAPAYQERAFQDLACPRIGRELTRRAPIIGAGPPDLSNRLEQDTRLLRERENRLIQENLLKSEQEERLRREREFREETRFDLEANPSREDPGATNIPTGRIYTSFPTFIWIPITKATSYWIRVERSDGWSVLETTPGTPFTLSRHLPPGWLYRWFYRGWNLEVGGGPWCFGGEFNLYADLLRPPELLEPKGRPRVAATGRQISSTPTFVWTRVPAAEQYHFSLEAADGSPVYEVWVQATTLVLPFPLEPGERYRWRVSSWNAGQGEGWSAPDEEFETAAPPLAAPTPLPPPATAAANPPTFAWNGVRGAALYRLTVIRDEGMVVLDTWTGETEYTPPRPLPADAGFRWWVRAWNGREGEGPNSSESALRTPPALREERAGEAVPREERSGEGGGRAENP